MITHNAQNNFTGHLGNKMFQAAAVIGIATRYHLDYALPPNECWQNFSSNHLIIKDVADIEFTNYEEPSFEYHPLPTAFLQQKNVNLIGYYQSIWYWNKIEKQIRETFVFNKTITEKMSSVFADICNKNYGTSKVAIHVRRGDYLNHPSCHPVLPIKYYAEAASQLQFNLQKANLNTNVTYLIFSDDIEWCKQNFEQFMLFKDKCIFIEGNTAAEDMCLMSMCQHHIIANSTFSWWSSYLSNNQQGKIIMAPTKYKWFGIDYKDKCVDDLYLSEWRLVNF